MNVGMNVVKKETNQWILKMCVTQLYIFKNSFINFFLESPQRIPPTQQYWFQSCAANRPSECFLAKLIYFYLQPVNNSYTQFYLKKNKQDSESSTLHINALLSVLKLDLLHGKTYIPLPSTSEYFVHTVLFEGKQTR